MFPLYFLAIIWLVFLGIFIILASLTILQMLRFGINEPFTKYITLGFVVLSLIIIFSTLFAISKVDLKQPIDFNLDLQGIFTPNNSDYTL